MVIPTTHGKEINVPARSYWERIQSIAEKSGYFYEGVGEGGRKGYGPEKEFLERIGVNRPVNKGSYDDRVNLGGLAGYTLFTNLKENPATSKAIAKVGGSTAGDVLSNSLVRGIGTFQGIKLTLAEAKSVLSIARRDGLDLSSPGSDYARVLRQGEKKMWCGAGGNPDGSCKGPLGNYAYQANRTRRRNLVSMASRGGGVYFIGKDHLPALVKELRGK